MPGKLTALSSAGVPPRPTACAAPRTELGGMAHLRGAPLTSDQALAQGKLPSEMPGRTRSLDQGGEAIRDYVLWSSGGQNKGASTVRLWRAGRAASSAR